MTATDDFRQDHVDFLVWRAGLPRRWAEGVADGNNRVVVRKTPRRQTKVTVYWHPSGKFADSWIQAPS